VKANRRVPVLGSIIAIAVVVLILWTILDKREDSPPPASEPAASSKAPATQAHVPTAAERLVEGYADPATPPSEDLKKVHRVITGYFSVVKDASRFPIGGNADLAAALRGENPNRETYLPEEHPLFSKDGLLIDRWGSPLVVHPEAWTQLELRSAGPDKIAYTADDLVVKPSGESSN
jgi:hypothetical protein